MEIKILAKTLFLLTTNLYSAKMHDLKTRNKRRNIRHTHT